MLTDLELQNVLEGVTIDRYGGVHVGDRQLKHVGRGCSRAVYPLPGTALVLKVSCLRDGRSLNVDHANLCEWLAWHTYFSTCDLQHLFATTYQLVLFPGDDDVEYVHTAVVQEHVMDGGSACRSVRLQSSSTETWNPLRQAYGRWLYDLHDAQFVYSARWHMWRLVDYACVMDGGEAPQVIRDVMREFATHTTELRIGEKPLVIGGVDDLRKLLVTS